MLIITLIIFLVFIILVFISKNFQKEFINSLSKKEHPLRFLYSSVAFVRHAIYKEKENLNQKARILSYQKGATALFCLLSFSSLIVLNELYSLSKPAEIINNTIQRPTLGEGDKTVDAIYKSEYEDHEVQIRVSEEILQGEQRELLLDQVEAKLDSIILGENSSAGEVTKNLYFPKTIQGTNVKLLYTIHNQDLIQRDGSINFQNVSKEGNRVRVSVCLSYEETEREKNYEFLVYPQVMNPEVELQEQIEKELLYGDEASKQSSKLVLPSEVGDIELQWEANERNNSLILFVVGIVITALMPLLLESRQKQKEEKRMNQMKRDYPEIISKFQLLLTAGMTTKGAWDRIVKDYLRSKQDRDTKSNQIRFLPRKKERVEYSRAAYEEMVITRREQELGVTEGVTYERFGRRCQSISYVRFGTILSQNLKMGSRGIAQLLEQEAREAFGERKEQAKQLGEKASTKLLGPTMGMLVIVLVIILVPALMSF